MFFIMWSNDSFNFPLGWIKYVIVIRVKTKFIKIQTKDWFTAHYNTSLLEQDLWIMKLKEPKAQKNAHFNETTQTCANFQGKLNFLSKHQTDSILKNGDKWKLSRSTYLVTVVAGVCCVLFDFVCVFDLTSGRKQSVLFNFFPLLKGAQMRKAAILNSRYICKVCKATSWLISSLTEG